MTVRYLFRETYRRAARDTVMLFHAAAGGVGLIACQWAKALGATLIGTVGLGREGRARARARRRARHQLPARGLRRPRARDHGRQGLRRRLRFDRQGHLPGSLDCLKPRGMMVSFGNASGPVPPFELTLLKGSLYRHAAVAHGVHGDAQAALRGQCGRLFDMVARGLIKIKSIRRMRLKDAAQAHRDLEARETTRLDAC